MRPDAGLTRRGWLRRVLGALAAGAAAWGGGPLAAWAGDIDHFTGTPYVGKNRAGPHAKFYINYWKPFRRIDPQTWSLEVAGLCGNPGRLRLADVLALPRASRTSRLKCVECWSAKAVWAGFHFSALENHAGPLAEAEGVRFLCADEYVEHLPLDILRHPHTLLATHMNGRPLSDEHGFPLRIIAPMKYGYKNPKAIVKMEFTTGTPWGTWSKIGPYSPDGGILPGTDHPLDRGKTPHRIPGGEITGY